jgi:hypothetical protein
MVFPINRPGKITSPDLAHVGQRFNVFEYFCTFESGWEGEPAMEAVLKGLLCTLALSINSSSCIAAVSQRWDRIVLSVSEYEMESSYYFCRSVYNNQGRSKEEDEDI